MPTIFQMNLIRFLHLLLLNESTENGGMDEVSKNVEGRLSLQFPGK